MLVLFCIVHFNAFAHSDNSHIAFEVSGSVREVFPDEQRKDIVRSFTCRVQDSKWDPNPRLSGGVKK
ncbi:MAG: hypothetical protein O2960_05465, partial [Verrucomicrobia bacterium]|nr:hypothetical protein [Verrucomicrobiota bacterium]